MARPRYFFLTYHSKVDFIVSRGSLSKVDSAPVDPSVTVPYILQEEAQYGGVFRQKEGGPAGQARVDPVLGWSRASHVVAKQTKFKYFDNSWEPNYIFKPFESDC